MKKYAKQDVVLLADLYKELLPWINNHPSLSILTSRPGACPKCGSEEGLVGRGFKTTKTLRYRQYQCKACSSYIRSRVRDSDPPAPLYV